MIFLGLLQAALLVLLAVNSHSQGISDNAVTCSSSAIEIIFLVDVSAVNDTAFAIQQHRLLRTLRHIDLLTTGRPRKFGLIQFHRTAETLLELASPFASDTTRLTNLISSLHPNRQLETSVARALENTAEQFSLYSEERASRVVLLAHDGVNTDLVAETLEAVSTIEQMNVEVFALSGNARPNAFALLGYTGDRSRLYLDVEDNKTFQDILDEVLASCSQPSPNLSTSSSTPRRAFGIRAQRAENSKTRVFHPGQACGYDRADVLIVLDTSGSVFRVFEDQRKIAVALLQEIPNSSFAESIQVGVVRFAADADVILPLVKARAKEEIINTVKGVKFTGQNTRIAGAVEIAVDEMERARRKDAKQIVILISDGHGQEYWNVVQATGKRLQETGAELFAVSASRDYNEAELLIYVGDRSRVFVGPKYSGFMPIVSAYLRSCVSKGDKSIITITPKHTVTLPSLINEEFEKKLATNSSSSKHNLELEGSGEGSGEEKEEGSGTEGVFRGDGDVAILEAELSSIQKEVEATEKKGETKLRDITQPGASTCEVDLVLIIDRSQSVEDDFNKQIAIAISTVELFPLSDYVTARIRVGAVSFAQDAKVELHLQSGQRENIVSAIERIEHTGGTTSTVSGAELAIARLLTNRRPSARLVTLLFSDGHSQDYWQHLIETSMRLRDSPNSVLLAFTASNYFSKTELQAWTGVASNVFLSDQANSFLEAVADQINKCTTNKEEFSEKTLEVQSIGKKETLEMEDKESKSEADKLKEHTDDGGSLLTRQSEKPELSTSKTVDLDTTTTIGLNVTEELDTEEGGSDLSMSTAIPSEDIRVHGIRTASDVRKISEGAELKNGGLAVGCKVDLLFVIDTSTSVEADFQLQLQFAVDLVKRLPSDDFERRVRIGAIVFHSKANLTMSLDQSSSRSSVLDSLLAIHHSGGSTSVASGVSLAVDELERTRREGVRQMVILLSDGNSQDHWDDVIRQSNRLRSTGTEVYAVTVSKKYMFRELELYAGDKFHVYIDARTRQFLDEVERRATQCGRTSTEGEAPSSHIVSTDSPRFSCSSDPVDMVLVLDTSTSVVDEFYREKQFASDLIQALPDTIFQDRLRVGLVSFSERALTSVELGAAQSKRDILFELDRISHTENITSIVVATEEVLKEVTARHRPSARLIVVIVSDGNSQDKKETTQTSAASLLATGADIFAVTLSEKYNLDELKEYTGSERHLYVGNRTDSFIQDMSALLSSCDGQTSSRDESLKSHKELEEIDKLVKFRDDSNRIVNEGEHLRKKKCKYDKMDLQIILDASSSRKEVFEHQRELALSLIERLPISTDGAHVAVGINSFTSVPTLRLTLGLGRDKKMVRSAVEDITYHGGSTLTAQAVELSVDDLIRGRRPDALQVVVLMNDGFSQDSWDRVLSASDQLAATRAERFGVALGDQVDLRELERYVGRKDRIYRDGTTEEFLSAVVGLLQGEKECAEDETRKAPSNRQSIVDDCSNLNLDLVVLFDNTDKSPNMKDPTINANRYLLLDVLGSLPSSHRVRIMIISFSNQPKVELDFTDLAEKDKIFTKVEGIKAVTGHASYSKAVSFGLENLHRDGRADANAVLIIVGDGENIDSEEEKLNTQDKIKQTPGLTCLAVDSSAQTDTIFLHSLTGDSDKVFPYERNADFAKQLLKLVTVGDDPRCQVGLSDIRARIHAAAAVEANPTTEWVYSTIGPLKINRKENDILRDIHEEPLNIKKFEENKALTEKSKKMTTTVPPKIQSNSTSIPKSTTLKRHTEQQRSSTTLQTSPLPIRVRTTSPASVIPSRQPSTPSFATAFPERRRTTEEPEETPTTFKPGCLLDVIVVLDSSGSVEETFRREKELAAGVIERLRIGTDNARVSIIKFAGKAKVKTVWSFADIQTKRRVLRALNDIPFSSGTTAIHSALLKAISEYTADRGARPGQAKAIAIIFTDGFGQKSAAEEALLLRRLVPDTYAIAINHQFPISRPELEVIVGGPQRVFTDANIDKFHDILRTYTKDCVIN